MSKILIIILLTNIMMAKDVPLFLAETISDETAALIFHPSSEWKTLGYNSYYKNMIDAAFDDSGNVHIVINEHYRDHKHTWSYLQYDKQGKKLFKKEIYSANYITTSHNLLVSRVLINPDMTVLVFYPDSEFYTCWVKVDKKGNIIERNEPRWWRGDAGFRVCSAGQDSFHIIAFPVSFWSELIKKYDPEIGEYYEATQPMLIPVYFYSNNFLLKAQRVVLKVPYKTLGVSGMIPLPDEKIFCFSDGRSWIMDSQGRCYDGTKFKKEEVDEICFAKVKIDTILESLAKEVRVPLNWSDGSESQWIKYFFHIVANSWGVGLGLLHNSTVGVSIYRDGAFYLIRYDLNGKIVQKGKGFSNLVRISEMDKERVSPFITAIRIPERRGEALDKTIFYWGFDDKGNFFLQIY